MKEYNDVFPENKEFREKMRKILNINGLHKYAEDPSVDRYFEYAIFLREENKKYNLTAITDADRMILLHFTDSLLLAKAIEEYTTGKMLLDIGSGAGLPAIPLAIAFPDMKITALDATLKKVDFINEAAKILKLDNLIAINGRAEEICGKEMRNSFDIVTARAVAEMNILTELAVPALKINGIFAAMKGEKAEEELKGSKAAEKELKCIVESIKKFELKNENEIIRRNIILIRKNGDTTKKYPRAYAAIKKKPIY